MVEKRDCFSKVEEGSLSAPQSQSFDVLLHLSSPVLSQ